MVKPPGFDPQKKYPLFVVIHGGPHNMWKDDFIVRWNYHLLAAPGYVVLLTNYSGSTGFGEQFSRAIQGDPLRTPGEELNQAADEAIRRFTYIDGGRQAAGGVEEEVSGLPTRCIRKGPRGKGIKGQRGVSPGPVSLYPSIPLPLCPFPQRPM